MSYRLVFTDSYNKKAAKWIQKHPTLKGQYLKTLQLMELDIHHPSLRLHKLSGSLSGLNSVSINMSYRITINAARLFASLNGWFFTSPKP